MPYFIFKYHDNKFKSIDYVNTFETYKEAKNLLKNLRSNNQPKKLTSYKLVFAEDILEAEMLILDKREAPILKEWEK